MKIKSAIFLCFFVLLSCAAVVCAAEPALYMVSADIVATTETPGMKYERLEHGIEYVEGLKEALIYGNIVKAVPTEKGDSAEAFDSEGQSIGYVDIAALAPMPKYEAFPAEPFRFNVDSPDLFLLPGSLPITAYTLPDSASFYVIAGEVTDGVGVLKDENGEDWTLLRFQTEVGSGVGFRYAFARSGDLMRLSSYKPDYTKVDSVSVPRNLRDFGPLEEKFYQALLKNGFALSAAPLILRDLKLDDLVESYPDSVYQAVYVPNFITTDLFLHAFHLVFSRGLRNIEEINFAPGLDAMLSGSLKRLEALERKAGKDKFIKNTFALARDFLTVPALLISPDLPGLKPSERAKGEIARILKAEGIASSALSGMDEDYTFYKPRGHYTSSDTLSRYFRAMAFLGGMPVLLNAADAGPEKQNTALIALLCMVFDEKNLLAQWDAIYDPLTYLIGKADDPSIRDYAPVVKKILNGKADKLADAKTLAVLRKEFLAAAPVPGIIDRVGSRASMSQKEREDEAIGFRLMGRRFVLDAWIFARLTSPQVGDDATPRNLPKAEDVMAALGSLAADAVLSGDKRDIPHYAEALKKVKEDVYAFFREGSENVTADWLGALALLFADKDSKQFFWNSPLWEFKKLLTASASWTELKHDTVLYAKQSYAEMGGGGEWVVEPFRKPVPRGYVEPAPQLFNALFNALDRLREIIAKHELGDRDEESSWHGVRAKIEAFREHVMLFRDIAYKEVRDEPLSMDDYLAISQITSYLNSNLLLDSDFVEDEDSDRLKMALVTDVATDALAGRVLHVATGTPRRIYVFVDDVHSGPRVAIGYTYSFYSFERSMNDGRMTDEDWRKLVYDPDRQIELNRMMPEWSRELFVE